MKEMVDWKDITVDYVISLHPSKNFGYQVKNKCMGRVKMFASTIINSSINLDEFVRLMEFTMILERICLERGFLKIRMKNRCEKFKKKDVTYNCKMEYIASKML